MYAKLLLIIQMHTRKHRAEDIISAKCQEKSGKCQGTGAKSQLQFFAAFPSTHLRGMEERVSQFVASVPNCRSEPVSKMPQFMPFLGQMKIAFALAIR